jgi:diguanylate cyclase (GGDEF)-like protein
MKILIADDEPVSRMRLAHALRAWGHDVLTAQDGDDAWKRIQACDGPMLLVIDWMMPGLDGLELCRRLRADPEKRFHHVIVLTSRSAMEDVVRAIDAGADDFIAKPYHPDEMKVRVAAGLRILRLQEELRVKASHDELTGVLNRRIVMELLERQIALAARETQPLSVCMLDIDHFKAVNDRHGHLVGDDVLVQAALSIQASMRRSDLLGRYGGEEFLLVLPGCDAAAAAIVAERARAAVSTLAARTSKGTVCVTASLGIATSLPGRPLDREALIGGADRALYRAKDAGRNRIEFAAAVDAAPAAPPPAPARGPADAAA